MVHRVCRVCRVCRVVHRVCRVCRVCRVWCEESSGIGPYCMWPSHRTSSIGMRVAVCVCVAVWVCGVLVCRQLVVRVVRVLYRHVRLQHVAGREAGRVAGWQLTH
jgi:hypothetical protein